jgi:hypothetical protein
MSDGSLSALSVDLDYATLTRGICSIMYAGTGKIKRPQGYLHNLDWKTLGELVLGGVSIFG